MTRKELIEGASIQAIRENEGHWCAGDVFTVRLDVDEYYINCNAIDTKDSKHYLNEDDPGCSWLSDFRLVSNPQA